MDKRSQYSRGFTFVLWLWAPALWIFLFSYNNHSTSMYIIYFLSISRHVVGGGFSGLCILQLPPASLTGIILKCEVFYCLSVLSHFSHVWLFATLCTVLPGSSVYRILQTRVLRVCCHVLLQGIFSGIEPESLTSPAFAGRFFTTSATREGGRCSIPFLKASSRIELDSVAHCGAALRTHPLVATF